MTAATDVRPEDQAAAVAIPDKNPPVPKESAVALRSGQTLETLTGPQQAALRAVLNFDPDEAYCKAEGCWNQIEAFLHFCITRGYDPIAREAYLIRRGTKGKGTYTIQTGIDGFRRKAREARGEWKFRRTVGIYWTSDDNSSEWWYVDPETHIRHRVWTDAWIWPDSNPAAAKCVIEYVDEFGEVHKADRVAHWGMYAPYNPKWEGYGEKRRKAIGADGKPVMELAEMWAKDGGAHQLGKCAEAAVLRATFPAMFTGIYVAEEMARTDAETTQLRQQEAADLRRARYAETQATKGATTPTTVQGAIEREDILTNIPKAQQSATDPLTPEPTSPTGPEPESATEPPAPVFTEDQRKQWLLEELKFISTEVGVTVDRISAMLGKRPGDATATELASVVVPQRENAVAALRKVGRTAEADAYAQVDPDVAAPLDILLGLAAPDDSPESDPDEVNEPHPFYPSESDANVCADCPAGTKGAAADAVHNPLAAGVES